MRKRKKSAGDYETVFGEDHSSATAASAFYADHAAPYWRALINQIHEFDFSSSAETSGGISTAASRVQPSAVQFCPPER
ncbi:MAG: hypothetical protein U1F42_02825 [Candidatus Competibacteraceae bacterium]